MLLTQLLVPALIVFGPILAVIVVCLLYGGSGRLDYQRNAMEVRKASAWVRATAYLQGVVGLYPLEVSEANRHP